MSWKENVKVISISATSSGVTQQQLDYQVLSLRASYTSRLMCWSFSKILRLVSFSLSSSLIPRRSEATGHHLEDARCPSPSLNTSRSIPLYARHQQAIHHRREGDTSDILGRKNGEQEKEGKEGLEGGKKGRMGGLRHDGLVGLSPQLTLLLQ